MKMGPQLRCGPNIALILLLLLSVFLFVSHKAPSGAIRDDALHWLVKLLLLFVSRFLLFCG